MTLVPRVTHCPAGHPDRPELEALIRAAFRRQHDAEIQRFMPGLLGLTGAGGRYVAAAGVRGAEEGPLFLERYLAQPVESLLPAQDGHPVERAQIVEVGNLASVHCRAACRLVAALPPMLLGEGRRWIVFTATDVLRAVLARLGAPLVELAPASAGLAPAGDHWGRYYARDPRVMAGYLPDGLRRALGR